jgi:hypothetical protein
MVSARVTLDRVANVATLIATIALLLHLGNVYYSRARARPPVTGYSPGDRVQNTPQLQLESHQQTLLVITASTCKFCTASMAFYRRLFELSKVSPTRVIAASREDVAENLAYLRANGLSLDNVLSVDKNNLRIRGTPTLLLVREDGIVVKEWVGQLKVSEEREVVESLGTK